MSHPVNHPGLSIPSHPSKKETQCMTPSLDLVGKAAGALRTVRSLWYCCLLKLVCASLCECMLACSNALANYTRLSLLLWGGALFTRLIYFNKCLMQTCNSLPGQTRALEQSPTETGVGDPKFNILMQQSAHSLMAVLVTQDM